jgi:hypothetical protein
MVDAPIITTMLQVCIYIARDGRLELLRFDHSEAPL